MFEKLLLVLIFISTSAYASEVNLKNLKWNGVDVTWIKDNRFPTYSVSMYFADGALSDDYNKGLTNFTFSLLESGTRRFSQQDIADNLEFYGVEYGADVTHESTIYSVSGLVKDIVPTMKKVCHVFQDAAYPVREIKKQKTRFRNSARSIINNHGALATKIIREVSLEGSPYAYPTSGKLKDLKRITQKRLRNKLKYFNEKVYKKIYIVGPSKVLDIEKIITDECKWNGEAKFVRETGFKGKKKPTAPQIYLVSVPNANQAQVRIGQVLGLSEKVNEEAKVLASEFLGGGFTSKLMREVRVKRGLSYGVNSYVGFQKEYGRAGIGTFTKVETITELLDVIKASVDDVGGGNITDAELEKSRGSLVGSYPFKFEKPEALLAQIISLDHSRTPYKKFFNFRENIKDVDKKEVIQAINDLFDWNQQTIIVVGPKSLKKKLEKFGKVKLVSYKKFL